MSVNFGVRYGAGEQVDWRKYEEIDTDDALLARTPRSVVAMLGFDPLMDKSFAADAASSDKGCVLFTPAFDEGAPPTLEEILQNLGISKEEWHGLSARQKDKLASRAFKEINRKRKREARKGKRGAADAASSDKEYVLFAIPKGKRDALYEKVITAGHHDMDKIRQATEWAKKQGFHHFRLVELDMTTPPDFTKGVRSKSVAAIRKRKDKATDVAPSALLPGQRTRTGKRVRTVRKVEPAEDLFGAPEVHVSYTNGEAEPYKPTDDIEVLATDAISAAPKEADMLLYHGLPVTVENLQGEERFPGVKLPADYGYINDVIGADGDMLDCYIGPSPESTNVFVVDQYRVDDPETFDEHKVMLGYWTEEDALEDYKAGHNQSDKVFAAITLFTMPMFRKWMSLENLSLPCSQEVAI